MGAGAGRTGKEGAMRTGWLILATLFALSGAAGAQDQEEFLRDFLPGVYRVVGKLPDSSETYTGRVVIRAEAGGFQVIRTIRGRTVTGRGRLESATADRVRVLRVRFSLDGRRYEATYLIHSDLDNYARLTGFVYPQGGKTADPGLEAFFIVH